MSLPLAALAGLGPVAGRALAVSARGAGAAKANPLLWYITRAAAVSAYVTLSVTVMFGICRSLARLTHLRASWALDETHRYLALLTAGFVTLHLLALIFDPLIPFAPISVLLPVAEPYRPFATDLGVLSLYGLAVVLLSSWLRRYIAYAHWRALHYTSFVVFVLVTPHGVLAGSDAGAGWMRLVYLGASFAVVLLALLRALWSQAGTDEKDEAEDARRSSTWQYTRWME